MPEFTVATLNMLAGKGEKWDTHAPFQELQKKKGLQTPDIVAIQECPNYSNSWSNYPFFPDCKISAVHTSPAKYGRIQANMMRSSLADTPMAFTVIYDAASKTEDDPVTHSFALVQKCTVNDAEQCSEHTIDFTMANVHMLGGRQDDYDWVKGSRKKSMQNLIERASPDIILGDFNGSAGEEFKNSLDGYEPYERDKEGFLSWQQEPFEVLRDHGYTYSKHSHNNAVEPTSTLGNVVDYIFVKESKFRIVEQHVVKMFDRESLGPEPGQSWDLITDHHMVVAKLQRVRQQ